MLFHHSHAKISLAAALAVGIVYSLKTLLMIWAPDFALQLKAAVWHKPVEVLQNSVYQITGSGFVTGLLAVMVCSYLIVCLTICIRDHLDSRKK